MGEIKSGAGTQTGATHRSALAEGAAIGGKQSSLWKGSEGITVNRKSTEQK